MSVTILIDGSNIAMAAHHAMSERLTDANGNPTKCIYGFLRMLRPMVERVQDVHPGEAIKIVVAWDSARATLWRRDVLPTYKDCRDQNVAARTPEEVLAYEEFVQQLPRLKALLPALGIGQITAARHEADDIAGWMTKKMPGKWVLMSGDYDWVQLINDDVWVWQPAKARFVNPANFTEVIEAKYEVPLASVEQYVTMKAIIGDDGDDVPGARGVGPKTAGKYVLGELEATTKAGKPAAKYDAITQWISDPDGYERSLKLVDLRDLNIPIGALSIQNGSFSEQLFMDACILYGFASIFDAFSGWIAPFRPSV